MSDFKPTNQVVISNLSGITILNQNVTNDALITRFVLTTSGSGGVALTSNASSFPFGIVVKNSSNMVGVSGVIFLGSSGSPPFISGGYPLAVTESVTLNITRPDFIRAYGTLSGVSVSWYGQLG